MSKNFGQIVVVDFEYEITPGGLPNVLCMVAYVLNECLQHIRTIRLWRGEFRPAPPFDIGDDVLFVAYSAWAEMICFLVLGWKFPKHIFDLHTAYLAASNVLLPYDPNVVRKKPRKRLSDACRAYGVEGWENIDKPVIAEAIGNGTWRERYSPQEIFDYCEEDVRNSVRLLRRQLHGHFGLAPASVEHVLHWSNYSAKAVAQIQVRGMLLDMPLWNAVQEHKDAVIAELVRRFDPSFSSDAPIYTPEGEWSYARFEHWLVRSKVPAWPRLDSGMLDLDSDVFRMMSHTPGISGLHALRDSLNFIAKARLPIGSDGRNRPSLFPFGTATGRNAHARSLFNAHAGMRSFLIAPPDVMLVYLDWRTQEVGIAAVLSGDQALMDAYRGDVYHSLALMCGLTTEPDPIRWKQNNRAQRDRMKPLQLGINYGMGVPSLARGLDRDLITTGTILDLHKRTYFRFWQWRTEQVQAAMLRRRIESIYGWPLHISSKPNKRTLYNFPMQANGAEMLRLAAWWLCEAGIVPSMLVHDGILIEARNQEQIEHAIEIMRAAGRDVCNGFEIGVDVDQLLQPGERYRDKRTVAQEMWATIMHTLEAVGALPRKDAA
jgi:hypothetical protein